MIPFPDTFDTELKTLPREAMTEAAQQAIDSLQAKGYEVKAGLTPNYADAIATLSHEPSIVEYCPKDSSERFTNRQATAEWLGKRRGVFLLLTRDGELAGYGWAGSKRNSHAPAGETTFSLRVGEGHQGKGLATPFALCMLAAADAMYGTPHIWLETWASNGGAVHVYNKLGFQTVAEEVGQRPTREGQMVTDTRLFMTNEPTMQD